MNTEKSHSFDRLLAWLDADSQEAGRKYVRFQEQLIEYLKNHGAKTVAEELTDEAFNRIGEKLASPLLSEHFNSREISDISNLCRHICDDGANKQLCPGNRIWKLLPNAAQSLAANLSRIEIIEPYQRVGFSQALNELLRRRDFYQAEDFNALLSQANSVENLTIEKIKFDIKRGIPNLSQIETEQFNRRLFEAAFPAIIKKNLADTPDEEKPARCKRYARVVLLEYLKEPRQFESSAEHLDNLIEETKNQSGTRKNPMAAIIEKENADEKRKKLDCQNKCKTKLSPRDSVILDMYFTGIVIQSPDDEPLSDEIIKIFRKRLAERFDVAAETIRTIAHRSREFVRGCIDRCMKRQENS